MIGEEPALPGRGRLMQPFAGLICVGPFRTDGLQKLPGRWFTGWMSWKQTDAMTERVKLITEYLSGNYSVSELSRRFEVSRRIVYKWIERYEESSWEGLRERSRAPHRQARALGLALEELILKLKQRWPDWGAPKLRQKLLEEVGEQRCPAEST